MEQYIINIVAGTAGAVGFSLLYNIKRQRIIPALIGAVLVMIIYDLLIANMSNLLIINMICSIFGTIYSEIMARIFKAPATIFLIPCIVPLVPGGYLYYTMYGIVTSDNAAIKYYANATLLTSLGIAIGIVIVSIIVSIKRKKFHAVHSK